MLIGMYVSGSLAGMCVSLLMMDTGLSRMTDGIALGLSIATMIGCAIDYAKRSGK